MPAWLKRIVPEIREGPAPEPALAPVPMAAFPTPAVAPAGGLAAPAPVAFTPAVAAAPPVPAPPAPPPSAPIPAPIPPPGTPMVAELRPLGASNGAERILLAEDRPLRFGREERNEIQLYDRLISPFHARLEFSDGAYVLTDLNSGTGVY